MTTATEKPDAPSVSCPTCAAPVPAADTAKVATTYLRCPACGDVWNPSRRATAYEQPRYFRLGPNFR